VAIASSREAASSRRVRDHGGDRPDGGAQGISQAVDLVGEDLAGEDADTIELSLGGLSITSY
jgi:hypothetical protein